MCCSIQHCQSYPSANIPIVYQHERISGAHEWLKKQTAGCTVQPADKTLSKDEEMKEWKRELKL